MDPATLVGTIGTAVGLADACPKLSKTIIDDVKAMREAPRERSVLLYEMINIEALLHLVINLYGTQNMGSPSTDPMGEMRAPFSRLGNRLEEVRAKIGPSPEDQNLQAKAPSLNSRRWKGKRDKVMTKAHTTREDLKWPFEKKQVMEHLDALERDESSELNLAECNS